LPAPRYPVRSVNGILGRSSGREGPASGSSDSRRLSVRSFFHEDTCDLTDSGTSSISISVLIMYDMASYFTGIWKSRWSCARKDRLAVPEELSAPL
jgi:hypothetical protein